MSILITGGTGFIGFHLVKKLSEQNEVVRCLVRNPDKADKLKELGVEIIQGDILKPETILSAMEGIKYVYHLAADPHPSSIKSYDNYNKINVQGTRNILEAASVKNIKKVLLMSSIAATGPSRDGKLLTEESPLKPVTHYGTSKVEVEKLGILFSVEKNLSVVSIRPPFVYGVGDKDWLNLFRLVKHGGFIKSKGFKRAGFPLSGDHENLFDFCYVDNLISGLIKAMDSDNTIGQVYFLSDTRPYKIKEIVNAATKTLGVEYPNNIWPKWYAWLYIHTIDLLGSIFRFEPLFTKRDYRWSTSNYWVCSCEKAKKDFAYSPDISLADGVEKTINWGRQLNLI